MIDTHAQVAVLHTYDGIQLYQFTGNELLDLTWTRDLNEVSRCELAVPSMLEYNRLPDLTPWLHWVSVWDHTGQQLHWTGPIQKIDMSRDRMNIAARDIGALFNRTRCPLTKRWDYAWPVDIAAELVQAMLDLHGLPVTPLVQPPRPQEYEDKYSFQADSSDTMLEASINDLVRLGLKWSVVSGVPVLGALSRTPIAALGEQDFLGDGLVVTRDGSDTYNDILLRGADNLAHAQTYMAGLSLQTIVNIDTMFGVSNVDRAAKQYVAYSARMHDEIALPDSAVLHPNAPVELSQLIPTARFTVDAYGLLLPMELAGVDVSVQPNRTEVAVRMTSVVPDRPELIVVQQKASISEVSK